CPRSHPSFPARRSADLATVIVTGLQTDAHKLRLARELGADHPLVVDGADAQDTVETVMDLTAGRGVDVALDLTPMAAAPVTDALKSRSEERRVGKECRCRWWPDQ